MNLELKEKNCLLYKNLDIISKRWVIFILLEFSKNPKEELRYFQIKDCLFHITPKILSQRLKILISEGFLKKREIKKENQKETFYSLTKTSISLLPILKGLRDWGLEHGCCIAKNECNRCDLL